MPLNINENEELPREERVPPPPMTHSTAEKGPMFTTATLVVLLIAIVASGVFLLYKYRVAALGMFGSRPSATAEQIQPLTDPWKKTPAASAVPQLRQEEPKMTDRGALAVYISSYRNRADAEEEAGRWVAAGFSSFVSDAGGWHRVAFGRFEAPDRAREEAEKWKQAFEEGYWIGPAH